MKLAEALIQKSYLSKKITELKDRLLVNGKIQEGDVPSEDIEAIFAELESVHSQLETITKKINMTNNKTNVANNVTISDQLVEKEMLDKKIATYKFAIENCQIKSDRYSRAEIKMITTFDIKKTRDIVEKLTSEKRQLDLKIQSTNWATDLL
jgi:hypothetical protein